MSRPRRGERRQEILEALARMLEQNKGERITTASLAEAVGVSEAALYRHFPSKGKMFEDLIKFIEETIFTRINRILDEERTAHGRIKQIMVLLLGFAEKNPGISRLIQGDVLVGETKKLRDRICQFFDRLETQIKQVLREGELDGEVRQPVAHSARLLLTTIEGRITQFVRTGFRESPVKGWTELWDMLDNAIFRHRKS